MSLMNEILRSEVELFTKLSGEDGQHTSIGRIGAYLDGYEKGKSEIQWIPVSERLPEDGQNVLVTYKTTDKIHPCQYHDDGSRNPWYSYIDQCRAHMNVVLAWMPLPSAYRGEGDF